MLLDGKSLANEIYLELHKYKHKFAVILVGNNENSKLYVKMKKNRCSKMNIDAIIYNYDENINIKEIINKIMSLNNDPEIKGIMVQLPLPKLIRKYTREILDTIDHTKDVDGLTSHSMGKLALNDSSCFKSCTPLGIIEMLQRYNIKIEGENVVIIGKSQIVGMPLSLMFSNLDATVTLCHIKTKNLKTITNTADILVVCCGDPQFIKKDYIKTGATIIDVGINIIYDYEGNKKVVGDVDFEDIKEKAGAITPVPGGVGPMTICMLIKQILQ